MQLAIALDMHGVHEVSLSILASERNLQGLMSKALQPSGTCNGLLCGPKVSGYGGAFGGKGRGGGHGGDNLGDVINRTRPRTPDGSVMPRGHICDVQTTQFPGLLE